MPTDATRDTAAAHNLEHGSDVIKVTTPTTAAKVCPRCTGTVFTRLRRCAACGWFIGWGS